jgi:CheY-like chemotaxis protein
MVNADIDMIKNVLSKLLSNAVKFTPANGKIELNAVEGKTHVEIFVKDNGIGMSAEHLNKLFKLDTYYSMQVSGEEHGTGLGLILCKEHVEKQGCEIRAESIEGQCSTFYFTLPLISEFEDKKLSQDAVSSGRSTNQGKSLKILIAEDDSLSALLLTRAVELYCDAVMIVTNGVDAVETCHNNPDIDLVLMDIKMPQMDGYEATKQIRQFNKDMVIIAQTAYSLSYDRQNALDAGCNDYISKPYNQALLVALMKKYFELRQKG